MFSHHQDVLLSVQFSALSESILLVMKLLNENYIWLRDAVLMCVVCDRLSPIVELVV